MKKETIKNRQSSKMPFTNLKRRQRFMKKGSPVGEGGVDSQEYAKAMSYLVSLEENETRLMIASATALSTR